MFALLVDVLAVVVLDDEDAAVAGTAAPAVNEEASCDCGCARAGFAEIRAVGVGKTATGPEGVEVPLSVFEDVELSLRLNPGGTGDGSESPEGRGGKVCREEERRDCIAA